MLRLSLLCSLLLGACAPTEEQRFIADQRERCSMMGGTLYYNETTRTAECYRHPLGRMTKTLFKEPYNAPVKP